jgi:chromosome segregation ATPase
LAKKTAEFNEQESRFFESSKTREENIRRREDELVRSEKSLNLREARLDEKAETLTAQILVEEERLNELTDKCLAASREVQSLNEEAAGIRASINSNLTDANVQLNRVKRDIDTNENDLNRINLQMKKEYHAVEEMKRRKVTLTNEVRTPIKDICVWHC